ncbi:YadA C-terminal domain-containing protein, partial [Dialister succinatiphilus]|uniref:YadA C-terminal domain-containing protein n=1 Tax=Dialister succinatiphilus TaxID=487173 RepID=UPI00307A10C0
NIEANANTLHKVQGDVVDIQNTLKDANALASADATKAATQAASAATEAADNANTVANGLKDRVDLISNNQNVTSESDLIKKDQSVGQNLTNVDKALHKEISDRQAADDKLKGDMKKNLGIIQGQQDEQDNKIADHENRITANAGKIKTNTDAIKANSDKIADHEDRISSNANNIEANANTLHKVQGDVVDNHTAIQKEISDRQAADDKLKGDMKKNLGIIQGQQDEQDNKIADHENRITANAGKIKTNTDAIKANSDKIADHEDRISSNANNIEANANTLHKVQGDVVDNKNAISAEAAARGDKDKEHDTAIAANKKAIGDEAAARQADVSRLDNKIHDVSKEVDTVGALSMAMSGLHPLSYDEGDARFQLSAAVGTYDGTEALALGGFYHFNRDSMLSVGVATDLGADEHRMGANVGYTRRIGQGGHVSRPSEGTVSDIMKDIKNLEQKQAKLEQENEQLKQQLAALKK